ncbi:MAG: flavin monoamine oxidase family protein [Bdellovibrio sp.]
MKNSRRQFLKSALFGTAGLVANKSFALGNVLTNGSSKDIPSSKNIEKCHCLVIGAGMSGLTAARNLSFPNYARTGFKTIVLEASGRIGGRVLTMEDPRFHGPIEMGAEYLHRKPGSVEIWNDINFYKPKIKEIARTTHSLMFYDGWGDNLRSHISMAFQWNLLDIVSFSNAIDSYQGPNISAKQWLDQQQYAPIGRNLVDLYFTGHMPGRLDEISVLGFGSDRASEQELEGSEYAYVDGYSSFLDQFMLGRNQHEGRELDVRFHSVVSKIKHGPNGVEVTTRDGKMYWAPAVIITVSVGMLKSGEITFDPPLPQSKTDALACMGMGDEAKIALKFKDKFWPDDIVMINSIANEREMGRTYHLPHFDNAENNNVIVGLFAGAEADKIKNMADVDVVKAMCRDFDRMYPSAAAKAGGTVFNQLEFTRPNEPVYMRWQWSQDPYSKGADSYLKAGIEKTVRVTEARKALASPQSTPGLFWAGEATVAGEFTQPCSTHGAHFSGSRASVEVEQYLRNFKRNS